MVFFSLKAQAAFVKSLFFFWKRAEVANHIDPFNLLDS